MNWLTENSDFLIKAGITIFFVLATIFFLLWRLSGSKFGGSFLRMTKRFIVWIGLDNHWSMFAPDPMSQNLRIAFELEFKDGNVEPWFVKEFDVKGDEQLITNIRYFKWYRRLLADKNEVAKKSMCEFLLQQWREKNPDKDPPVVVRIIEVFRPESAAARALFDWMSSPAYSMEVEGRSNLTRG